MEYPESIKDLIKTFSKLPGIGPKSAEKLAFFILNNSSEFAETFAKQLTTVKIKIKNCKICGNYSETDVCPICSNPNRDKSKICIVETPKEVLTIERLNIYNGLYHVLFGVISPLDGIGPEKLNLKSLFNRLSESEISEIIIATNPTPEGDTTGTYISKKIKNSNSEIKITRLAYGIPVGANLDYTDIVTLTKSFLNRNPLE